jgi:hypothetical protein
MNPLARIEIDFAAEPTALSRLARRAVIGLAVVNALAAAAVGWLTLENGHDEERLATLLAARQTAASAKSEPSPPPDLRLEAIQRRLRHDWTPAFQTLDRIAAAEGIRVNSWSATASGEVRTVIVEAESADSLARLLGALNGPEAEPAVYWYAAQIGPGIGGAQGRLKVRIVGAGVRQQGS